MAVHLLGLEHGFNPFPQAMVQDSWPLVLALTSPIHCPFCPASYVLPQSHTLLHLFT